MHALQISRDAGDAGPPLAETERLILCSVAAAGEAGDGFALTVVTKSDRRLVARMQFAMERRQEARLTLSLGAGAGIPDLVAEAAKVAMPMAMALLGARVLRAGATAGDQATIGVLRRLGMHMRGIPGPRLASATLRFEKDLCGIM